MSIPAGLPARAERSLGGRFPGSVLLELRELTAGASGITLLGQLDTGGSRRPVVLKTIPVGLLPTRNRDLGRQVRILEQLRASAVVPVPEVLAYEAGEPPGQPPFYVVEFVPGDSFDPTNPASAATGGPPAAVVASRAHAAVRVLAELQALDVGRLAEPPSSLLEELTRWQRAFATTDGPHTEPAAELGRLLGRRVPAAAVPALVHGDFRLGNLLYEGSSVRAVLDWEIWSVGDPRLDLAWFVARASDGHPARPEDRHGFPSAAALLDTYAANPPDDFGWFLALAAFKHAAAAALLDKRGRPDDRHQPERVVDLLRWAGTQLAAAR